MCTQRILLYILALIKASEAINKNAYMVLSTKIQGVGMEVDFLRNELASTNEKLESIENILQHGNDSDLTSKECDKADPRDYNVTHSSGKNTEIQQYMTVLRTAWKSEKKRARDIERKTNQELLQTNRAVSDAKKGLTLKIENVKETLGGTTEKLSQFIQRLDIVEHSVNEVKNDQAQLLTFLQTDRVRMEKLELDFQNQNKLLVSLNEELKSTKAELSVAKTNINGKLLTLTTQQDDREKCQSGNGVGVHTYPSRSFPYTVTVRFNPPFKKTPAFVYGTVVLDATSETRYNAQLQKLTNEYFTISMTTWATYYLWGARVSWMACPK